MTDGLKKLERKKQKVSGYEINVSGERRDEYPRVFTDIKVQHIVRGRDIGPEAVKRAVDLSTNKYCSVIGMLKASVPIEVTYLMEQKEPAEDNALTLDTLASTQDKHYHEEYG